MYLTPSLPLFTIFLLSAATFLLYKFFTRNFDYWQKKKVFHFEPVPFFGNFGNVSLFRVTLAEYLAQLYNQTKEPFFGIYIYNTPHLVLRSPEVIKSILVRDFNNFDDRTIVSPPHDLFTSSLLFVNKNPEWKKIRTKLTPLFTTGKLKNMIPLINTVGDDMTKYIDKQIPHFELEAKEICAKFATDVIAKCAFGINAKCFLNDDAEFRRVGRLIFDFRWSTAIQQTGFFFLPSLVKIFRMQFLDAKAISFMRETFRHTIELRKKQKCKVNDLIDALIDMEGNGEFRKLVDFEGDKVVAQAGQFFVAGFETTSATIAFSLYELCLHPHIQHKLRTEIRECVQQHGECNYEAIQSMKYLHMCICETLRKYPVLPFLDRRCRNDYTIPGTNVTIEKGTPVLVPLFGLHYDEDFFPNPQKYKPERFSDDNLQKRTPYSYIPFGEGPRNCIGERLGLLGTKLGLIRILTDFEVERSSNTPVPLKFEQKSLVLASKIGLPMKFRRALTLAA